MWSYFFENTNKSAMLKAIVRTDQNYTPLNLSNEMIPFEHLQNKIQRWNEKSLHERYSSELNHYYVDKEQSFKWLTEWKLFPETEGFFTSIQDQVVATRNFRKHIVKDNTL